MATTPVVEASRASDSIAALRPASKRVLAIDVLRGVTIAFMILVNDPGDGAHVYAELEHASWNGWTLTDLVFPTFLFLVGAATIFSLDARIRKGDSRVELAKHLFLRAGKIFLLKMIITAVPYFHMTHLRIYGVLTRIAICYLLGGLILLGTRSMRILAPLTAAILAAYWAIMRLIPVPGYGLPGRDVPFLDKDGNLAAWIDRGFNALCQRILHTGVLYEHTRDPEGLLSTLPAVATVLIGAMAALWLRDNFTNRTRARNGLILAGLLSFAAGIVWGFWFPINKNLWTSTFVLMAAGWAMTGLGLFFWLIDDLRLHETNPVVRWLTKPALIFGSNAIFAYTMSAVFVKTFAFIRIHDGDKIVGGWSYAYQHLFARGNSTDLKSVLFALCFVVLCFLPNLFLYRRKIFLKL